MTRHDLDNHDDPIFNRLSGLDPVGHDAPPAAGSPRFNDIKENAMQMITRPDITTEYQPTNTPIPPQRPVRRYRRALLGAAAAIAALTVGAVIVVDPGGAPSAEALVLDAASNLAQYDSLRASLVRNQVDGSLYEGTAEFDGQSVHTEFVETGPDGDVLYTEGITVIGETIWSQNNDEIFEEQTGPNDRLTPFPEASEAVITAALQGADVEPIGAENVRGTDADRYRIVQTTESRSTESTNTVRVGVVRTRDSRRSDPDRRMDRQRRHPADHRRRPELRHHNNHVLRLRSRHQHPTTDQLIKAGRAAQLQLALDTPIPSSISLRPMMSGR